MKIMSICQYQLLNCAGKNDYCITKGSSSDCASRTTFLLHYNNFNGKRSDSLHKKRENGHAKKQVSVMQNFVAPTHSKDTLRNSNTMDHKQQANTKKSTEPLHTNGNASSNTTEELSSKNYRGSFKNGGSSKQMSTTPKLHSKPGAGKSKLKRLKRMEMRVHNSVFMPDQCGVTGDPEPSTSNGTDQQQPVQFSERCWHSKVNGMILPHLKLYPKNRLCNVLEWTVDTVYAFVRSLPGCPLSVAEKFRAERMDGEAFLLLDFDDIINLLNIRLGPALKIHGALMYLRHQHDQQQPRQP